jgi:hypothetical protein
MTAAASIAVSNSVTYQGPTAPVIADADTGLTFGEVFSDLNPLQYLPVVGTLYRAITGDTIPRPLREAGSLLVSGLIGGPIGVATNLAMLGFEKITGIDLEEVEQNVITALMPDKATPVAASAAPSPAAVATAPAAPAAPAPSGSAAEPVAWTPAQLAAYGVVKGADGELHRGGLSGADVLNALQLRATAGNQGA